MIRPVVVHALLFSFIVMLLSCAQAPVSKTETHHDHQNCQDHKHDHSKDHKHHSFEVERVTLPDSEATYFNRKNKVFFTGDFSVEDLPALKKWGIQYVLYLVDDIEPTPEMFESVESAGMTVLPLDFQWEGRRAHQRLEKIEKVFMTHHKQNSEIVAVVSSDLDNVRGWLAYHLRKAHRMSVEDALNSSESLDAFSSEQVKAKARKLIQKI